ncbi:hypothetical protein HDV00_005827 [Rhizophlyctis rosea]|nr:hypothetical protein HDV00_005827 [Rhizophlyctis rosea]
MEFEALSFYSFACRGASMDRPNLRDYSSLETDLFRDFTFHHTYLVLKSFSAQITPKYIPIYNHSRNQKYDPSAQRSPKSKPEQQAENHEILSELLPEFCVLEGYSDFPPSHDRITVELCYMAATKEISLLTVFAAQLLLDITHLLGSNIHSGYKSLHQTSAALVQSLRDRAAAVHKPYPSSWFAQNEGFVTMLEQIVDSWVFNDRMGTLRRGITTSKIEPFLLFKRHPLLCGMFQFRLQGLAHELGLTMAGAWGSILYAGHLYQAGINSGLLEPGSWKDMEWVMAVHGKERMFKGRVPSNAKESFTSFCLMLGTSPTAFSGKAGRRQVRKGSASAANLASSKGPSNWVEVILPVVKMFEEFQADPSKRMEITDGHVETLVKQISSEPSNATPTPFTPPPPTWPPLTTLPTQWHQTHKLTPTQLLLSLRQSLHTETQILHFDYISLHTRCIALLRAVRTVVHDDLERLIGKEYIENESQLPTMVGWILMLEHGTSEKLLEKKVIKEEDAGLVGGTVVSVKACGVLKDVVEREGRVECAKMSG